MPWKQPNPSLTNSSAYLEPRVSNVETSLAERTSDLNGRMINVLYPPLPLVAAKGDGVTNDQPAIQNIINSLTSGGIVFFPVADYLLKGTGTELLLITKPIRLVGTGFYSKLKIDSSVPNTTDVIRISPSTSFGKDLSGIDGLQIVPVSGTPAQHGIHLDVTNSGQYLSRYVIERNFIQALGGRGVYLSNPTNLDGFFASVIRDNLIYGGMYFERLGDSINIERNTITGSNTGIQIPSITSGATVINIVDNNITSDGGAIKVDAGNIVKIEGNQMEQVNVYTGATDAMVYIGNVANVDIKGNNMTAHGNVAHNIHVNQGYRTKISKNTMRQGTAEIILVDSTANKTDIAYDNFYINTSELEIAPSILDNGIGTMGIRKNLTPSGSWVVVGGSFAPWGVRKFSNGDFQFTGQLQSGTTTAGTVIGTLPVGIRPDMDRRIHVGTWKTGSPAVVGSGVLVVGASGTITIETLDSAVTRLDFDGITLPAIY